MVSSEVASLFGVTLAFHGMVLFARDGRLRPLLAKACVALLLGWHVLALIAPFVVLGLAGDALRARSGGASPAAGARRALAAAVRSPRLRFGVAAGAACLLLLGWNLASEYAALGGEVAPADLPSLRSLLFRAGVDDTLLRQHAAAVEWGAYLREQLARVALASAPFAAARLLDLDPADGARHAALAVAGAALFAASLASLAALRERTAAAALLLTGWGWALAFRASAACTTSRRCSTSASRCCCSRGGGATALRRFAAPRRPPRPRGPPRLPRPPRLPPLPGRAAVGPGLAVLAALVFVLSAAQAGSLGAGAEAAARQREVASDFEAIRAVAGGRGIDVGRIDAALSTYRIRDYELTGSFVNEDHAGSAPGWRRSLARSEFILLPADLGGSLTPGNRRLFLYRVADLDARFEAEAAAEPAIASGFGARIDGRALILFRDPCRPPDAEPPFRLEAVAADAADLPPERRAAGFEAFAFRLGERGARLGNRCLAIADLPDYAVAGVRVGQRAGGLAIREASLPVADASFPREAASWRDGLAGREPALRAHFDVYLEGRTLTWVREGYSEEDAAARFLLHVTPADAADLPPDRRAAGFDRLDFAFGDRGARWGGTCMAEAVLPAYPVARVRTGQHEDGVEVWAGEFEVGERLGTTGG